MCHVGLDTCAAPPPTADRSYQWQHPLSDVIDAPLAADLALELVHEFPFGPWQRSPSMVQREDGWWHLAEPDDVPLLLWIRAPRAGANAA
jgi:hypothetical protein